MANAKFSKFKVESQFGDINKLGPFAMKSFSTELPLGNLILKRTSLLAYLFGKTDTPAYSLVRGLKRPYCFFLPTNLGVKRPKSWEREITSVWLKISFYADHTDSQLIKVKT